MTEQTQGAISSIIIHGVILSLLFAFIQNQSMIKKPVVIDFRLSHQLFTSNKPKAAKRYPTAKAKAKKRKPSSLKKIKPPQPKPLRAIPPPPEIDRKPRIKKAVPKKQVAPSVEPLPENIVPMIVEKRPEPVIAEQTLPDKEEPILDWDSDFPNFEPELPIDESLAAVTDSLDNDSAGLVDPDDTGGPFMGNSGETAATRDQVYLQQHFKSIHKIVQKQIRYPKVAKRMGWSGKVLVSFLVHKNGDVSDIKVIESSGYPLLDRSAIKTIRRIACFPKPPLSAKIIIPINFKLKTIITS